ncbi:hypothetical protein [Pseudorhodobacter sp.]|uniref:hypothetical protein n=1 Tax=Pseudorhodobacter sp. TaxID=1934400 RepID=UPI002AFF8C44|nr:hypothetical protein [Pseudorhodobacter sp.]
MTQRGANAAIARLDQAFTETEAAFSAALPSVPDMRQRAAHITRAGDRIDAEFAKRLDYGAMRVSARRLTSDAAAQIQPVEAAHRRLRRRLFWQLVWAKYRSVVWGLFGLAVVAGGGLGAVALAG